MIPLTSGYLVLSNFIVKLHHHFEMFTRLTVGWSRTWLKGAVVRKLHWQERSDSLFVQLRSAYRKSEAKRREKDAADKIAIRESRQKLQQLHLEFERKTDQDAEMVLGWLREKILEGDEFVRRMESGVNVYTVKLPDHVFGKEYKEREAVKQKVLERLFRRRGPLLTFLWGPEDFVNWHKLLPGFRVQLNGSHEHEHDWSFDVTFCNVRPVVHAIRSYTRQFIRGCGAIATAGKTNTAKRLLQQRFQQPYSSKHPLDPLAPSTDVVHISKMSPDAGEAGQLIKLHGYNLTSAYNWQVKWTDSPTDGKDKLDTVYIATDRIVARIPPESVGRVTVFGTDATGHILASADFSVVAVDGQPQVHGILSDSSFGDWICIQGEGFGLDSVVYVRPTCCDSTVCCPFTFVKPIVYGPTKLGFRLPPQDYSRQSCSMHVVSRDRGSLIRHLSWAHKQT